VTPATTSRIETFAVPLEVKQLEDDGAFRGLAAVFGNVDRQGDVIEPGAFDRVGGSEVPILANHDPTAVIGKGRLQPTADGLMIDGRLNLETQAGRETLSNLKFGAISGLSIGYNKRDFRIERDGVRRLLDLDVPEVSVTPFPANDRARVTEVKAVRREDADRFFVFEEGRREDLGDEEPDLAERNEPGASPFVLLVTDEEAGKTSVDQLGVVERREAVAAAASRAEREKSETLRVLVARAVGQRATDGGSEAVFQEVAAFRFRPEEEASSEPEGAKRRDTARPASEIEFSGAEEVAWADVDKSLAAFVAAFGTEDEQGATVSDLSPETRGEIAARTLLGDAGGETAEDIVSVPVVNPATDNLNRGGLNAARAAARGARGADLPDADGVFRVAGQLLEDNFGDEGEEDEMALSDEFRETLQAVVVGGAKERLGRKCDCPSATLPDSDRALLQEVRDALGGLAEADDGAKAGREDWSFLDGRKGQSLGSALEDAIDALVDDDTPRSEIIQRMADATGEPDAARGAGGQLTPSTVGQIVRGEINCPPNSRLEAFASVLGVSVDTLRSAAREDGCEFSELDEDEDEQMAAVDELLDEMKSWAQARAGRES